MIDGSVFAGGKLCCCCTALWLLTFTVLSLSQALRNGEELSFASYYGDHMVLQQAPEQAVLWGYGTGDSVLILTLTGELKSQNKAAYVKNGIWRVTLDPVEAGGPYNVTVAQEGNFSAQVTLTDVLFGDVWLCGGQSNMAFTVSQLINATEELAMAARFPHVRIFMAALVQSNTELSDLSGAEVLWSVPTPDLLGGRPFTHFSAVCWLFGRYLQQNLSYPVGLVESCWGGTPVEAWSSRRALQKCGLNDSIPTSASNNYLSSADWENSVLWNAMIHPLLNMTIKGAIWYQGEENTNYNLHLYNCTFPAMIDDWRMSFHEGSGGQTAMDFPFGFVQISTYQKNSESEAYPDLRWHQTADYGFAPNPRMKKTFMAVAMDLPDENSPSGSIHPRYKHDVALRLTLGARAMAYGEKNVSFQGPFPAKIWLDQDLINITYNQPVSVSLSQDIFEICYAKKQEFCGSPFAWAYAPIVYREEKSILLSVNWTDMVAAVRYAWRDWPCGLKTCPVYSADHVLPAPPFIVYRWP
uniref:Sialic acid acetylesterase n=1 Tax=Scleropages formosus TaxID=113540 RepID=A0A8C9U036_SCLFO